MQGFGYVILQNYAVMLQAKTPSEKYNMYVFNTFRRHFAWKPICKMHATYFIIPFPENSHQVFNLFPLQIAFSPGNGYPAGDPFLNLHSFLVFSKLSVGVTSQDVLSLRMEIRNG